MGIRQRRRMPTLYQPGTTFFTGGILLCITFGFILAAIQESYCHHDWGWFGYFCAGEIGCVALYSMNVRWWLAWMNLSGDNTPGHEYVGLGHEPPHYPGDR